jgi:hypothetical protein
LCGAAEDEQSGDGLGQVAGRQGGAGAGAAVQQVMGPGASEAVDGELSGPALPGLVAALLGRQATSSARSMPTALSPMLR